MITSGFEELEIYQLTENLSDIIWSKVIQWETFTKNTIGIQIVKAIDSVGANIAEGYGKETFAERARFVKISRGSLFETKHWVNKSYRRKLIVEEEFNKMEQLLNILLPKISAYINYLNSKNAKRK
jgi:four helix bundle protein